MQIVTLQEAVTVRVAVTVMVIEPATARQRMMMMLLVLRLLRGGRGDGGNHVPADGDYTQSPAGDDSVGDGVMMMAETAKVRRRRRG